MVIYIGHEDNVLTEAVSNGPIHNPQLHAWPDKDKAQ